MRAAWLAISMLVGAATPAAAQVSIGIGLPSVSIGINLGGYPDLVAVPGYPVYYAPQAEANLFFYDGLYWTFAQDQWYASAWYNGPWDLIEPESVPLFVLRVPVRYYRRPPAYFRGWGYDAPPRWGEHWGPSWEQRRGGWDRWDRAAAPRPAPLPTYQRQYSGDRYPHGDQQRVLRDQNYRYQPHEAVNRQHYQQPAANDQWQRSRGNEAQAQRNQQEQQRQQVQRDQQAQQNQQAGDRHNNQHQGRPEQGQSPHAQQASPARQPSDRPPARAPAQEPNRDGEHGRDHNQ